MVDYLSPIVSMLSAVGCGFIAFRSYHQRKELNRIREVSQSILEKNQDLEMKNFELLTENALLKNERIDPPNEYELAATYRSLGVEPPKELREAEAHRQQVFDDIMADLDALGVDD